MKKILFFASALFLGVNAQAQYMADAYRMSNYQIQGTARSAAMGNAIGAVGGDFTSLSVNPAGIGLYRTNEFSFSTSLKFSKTDLNVGNSSFSENDFKLHFNQLGYIGTTKSVNSSSSVVSFNYGIGYNKLADFNQSFLGSVNQSSVSFLDNIVDYANQEGLSNAYLDQNFSGVEYRDWPTKLAWDTYLIDPALDAGNNEIDGQYVNVLYQDEKVDQLIAGERSGRINEYLFSGGLNINHRLYLGATIGIHDFLYKQETNYTEFMTDDSYTYTDYLKLTGTGINFKLGAIVKPIQSLRLGIAWHSPTYYNMSEESVLSMKSYLSQQSYYSEGISPFDYDFHTPMKVVGSGAVLLQKIALISFDAEYVDYSTMRFRNGGSGDPMTDLNNQVKTTFEDVINYRVGAEIRVAKSFSLLAGYEYYANPIKATTSTEEDLPTDNSSSIAFGMGYSINNFYFDTAIKHYESKNTLYNPQPNLYGTPTDYQNNTVTFTLGFRF